MDFNEEEFYRKAAFNIFSSLNMDIALRRCLDYLKEYMPVSGLILASYHISDNILEVVASVMPPHMQKLPEKIQYPEEMRAYIDINRKRREILVINDPKTLPEPYYKVYRSFWPDHMVSALRMDLLGESGRVGNLALFAEGKHRYTKHHIHLMSLLNNPFAFAISKILEHQEIMKLRNKLAKKDLNLYKQLREMSGEAIIGADSGLKKVMEAVQQVSSLNSPVLLIGETGVGKEIITDAIHYGSPRKNRPFIKVNCGGIPETLIDSELFGYEKGAFTGAVSKNLGRFERAHTGTLFLDEIGDLPQSAQVKLLRVLQQHEIERVGGNKTIPLDVRIICATHRNLEKMVQSGQFRQDLWFRLNVFPITIPPLRQRTEDIPQLISYFIERKSIELNIQTLPSVSANALKILQEYEWPGNVRELSNLIERALIQTLADGTDQSINIEELLSSYPTQHKKHTESQIENRSELTAKNTIQDYKTESETILPLDHTIANQIRIALSRTNGKVGGKGGAAEILGLHSSTLRAKMRKYGIPHGRNC